MAKILAHWFNPSSPVGFIETPDDLAKTAHRTSFNDFFDSANFLSKCAIDDSPSTILGRRGSGKTAILYHLKHQGAYTFTVELETFSMFVEVASKIDAKLLEAGHAHISFVENYAKVWSAILYSSVIAEAYRYFKNDSRFADHVHVSTIHAFLVNAGLEKVRKPHQVLRTLLRSAERLAKVQYNVDQEFDFLNDFLDGVFMDEQGYTDALEALETLLMESGARALILMDSLEQFPIQSSGMLSSLGGLLHFAGKLKRSLIAVDLCFAFAAELHEELKSATSNNEKDFNAVLTLHWDVEEVFHICAHRFEVFRSLCPGDWQAGIKPPDEKFNREAVWRYWHQFLPARMTNRLGFEEDSIAYISRHTQLLPRHFINILNQVLSGCEYNGSACFPVSSDEVVSAVRAVEDNICEGILSGFELKFPNATRMCQLVIPHLPNVFNRAYLKQVIRDHGKGELEDVDEVLNTLVRIGALGSKFKVTEKYVECRFDYTYNGQMPYNINGHFGLHPAFAGKFRGESWAPKDRDLAKPVYPLEDFVGRRPGVSRLQ